MRIEEFRSLLKKQPFAPFAVHMSDGSMYPLTHPDQVILTPRAAFVGLDVDAEGLTVQEVVICDLLHVTRLTPVNGRRRKAGRTKRKS